MAVAVAGKPSGRVRPGLIVNVRRGEVLEGSATVTVTHVGQDGSVAQAPRTPGEYIEKSKEDLKDAFSGLRFLSGEEIRLILLNRVRQRSGELHLIPYLAPNG